MLTFTYKDDNKYFKMDIINDMKNYISKLIRNTKEDIRYYSNIEIGSDYDNPHLHIQFYYQDINQVIAIRDKTIAKYGLFANYCSVSIPKSKKAVYDYVIKDYLIKDDYELLKLDDAKIDYRKKLFKNIRFSSFSKEKYTKKIYKKAYSKGILKQNVDFLLDNEIVNKEFEIISEELILFVKFLVASYLIQYRINNKIGICKEILGFFYKYQYSRLIEYWIFGYI